MPRLLHSIVISAIMAGTAIAMQPLSRADTEAMVRKDLAGRLKVSIDQVEVVSAVERTWPDANLGCSARKGLVEPSPVAGFKITLACRGKRYVYHSDRSGRFRQCDVGKPVAPISR